MPKRTAKLVLPDFQLLAKQPKVPNAHREVATCTIKNRYGADFRVKVATTRKGDKWFVWASSHGMRASNTLSTGVAAKGKEWEHAVKACNVTIDGLDD